MDQFGSIDNNGGNDNNNPSIQSSPSNVPLAHTNDTTAVYKPLMLGSSPPPPPLSSPAPVYQSVGDADDSTMPETNISIPVSAEQTKRKRGKPRKNATDGSPVPGSGSLSSSSVKQPAKPAGTGSGGLPSSGKKRGRPLGSGRKNLQADGGSSSSVAGKGTGFTAQIIMVEAGEDIASKILSVAESGLQALCIITANGSVSNVTIRQNPSIPSGTVSYEGRFEIVTLSGSYIVSEIGGERNTRGGLSILLSGSDGHVLGGCIAGLLIAASQVQVVVGCFIPCKEYPWKKQAKQQSMTGGGGSPTSRGTMSECSGAVFGSPFNQISGGGVLGSPLNQISGGGDGGVGSTIPAWQHHYENKEQDRQHPW